MKRSNVRPIGAFDPAFVGADGERRAIYYAVAPLSSEIAHRRGARAEQSAASRRLLAIVEREAERSTGYSAISHSSLTHSRSIVAAAVGIGVRVGIDVEWMAPNRDGPAILETLCGLRRPRLSVDDFHRAWTFHEAYFKATGLVADAEMFRQVIDAHNGSAVELVPTGDGLAVGVAHMRWHRDFMLSIVWSVRTIDAPVDLVPVSASGPI